jgi:hypothetical protein
VLWGALLLVAMLALAVDWIPGSPHVREKNVTVYYPPHADTLGVSLSVQPPLASQEQGTSQLVPLEFTSHADRPLRLRDLELEPRDCFALKLRPSPDYEDPTESYMGITLEPGQTIVVLYDLVTPPEEKAACFGQYALVFRYRWQVDPAPAPANSRRPAEREPTQQAVVTTSPIEVVTPTTRPGERFFHIVGLVAAAILLPVLLWFLNSVYQRAQAKQDIWKAIFPGLLVLTQQHYLPILRRMYALVPVLALHNPPAGAAAGDADCGLLMEKLVLLRAQMQRLQRSFGGYHFRSKPGETMYGELEDTFWLELLFDPNSEDYAALLRLLEAGFAAEQPLGDALHLKDGGAWKTARDRARLLHSLQTGVAQDLEKMQALGKVLGMLIAVLEFECDRPLYPEWYPEPPTFPYEDFASDGRWLLQYKGLKPEQVSRIKAAMDDYLKTISKVFRRKTER